MPGWKQVDAHPTEGRTFQRPLSMPEYGFFLDGRYFHGTTDSIHHFQLRPSTDAPDPDVFSEANVVRAWLSTKRRHPLVGAVVLEDQGLDGATGPHFVVRERDLARLCPNEIIFGHLAGAEVARHHAAAVLAGPPPLSASLLVQLHVLRETATPGVLHMMLLVAHCVADMTAILVLARCFMDALARQGIDAAQAPLEDRLVMVVPVAELEPNHICALSPARRRWRRAIGAVILQLRMAKRQGGHTLPCRLTRSTPHVTARSGFVNTSLTRAQSVAVFGTCRRHALAFGNTFNVLAQVGMTRVLHRRYLRGEISEEEWAYRTRQPYVNGSPVNLRPYLDKAWFDKGGGGEFMSSMSFFFTQLPPMTPNERERVLSGAAPFSDILTFNQFIQRTTSIKKQTMAFLNHPLFLEIAYAGDLKFSERQRLDALERMKLHSDASSKKDEVLAVTDPPIWTHIVSSFGNTDSIFLSEYPIPSAHALSPDCPLSHPLKAGYVIPRFPHPPDEAGTKSKIMAEHIRTFLHTRPAELYIASATLAGLLNMSVTYDGNVFEEAVVSEWLDEVREAVLWYLGGEDERVGQGVQAKL